MLLGALLGTSGLKGKRRLKQHILKPPEILTKEIIRRFQEGLLFTNEVNYTTNVGDQPSKAALLVI